jgi:hypothetical protein
MRTIVMLITACVLLAAGQAMAQDYQSLRIVAPEQEATVHDNNGNVTVKVRVSPSLRAGDKIALLLDGAVVESGHKTRFALSGIDRGTHTLAARVAGAQGAVLIESETVTFHMWQASRLFPNRRH